MARRGLALLGVLLRWLLAPLANVYRGRTSSYPIQGIAQSGSEPQSLLVASQTIRRVRSQLLTVPTFSPDLTSRGANLDLYSDPGHSLEAF